MPKFRIGDKQITFIRQDGRKFTKTFHSIQSASDALKGWRKAGGKILKTGNFGGVRGKAWRYEGRMTRDFHTYGI